MLQERSSHKIRRILLLEDSPIIAFDLEQTLAELGVEEAVLAFSCAEAMAILADGPALDAALLDLYLKSESCEPVAERLAALGVPFGLFVGFGDPLDMAGRWPAAPLLHKPFHPRDLMAMLSQLG